MKSSLAILAWVTSAIAGNSYSYGPPPHITPTYGHPEVTKTDYLTTYTTVTTCPVTNTVTSGGSTYVETVLTTSTIVVTECPGGKCGGEATVTLPDTTVGTTTQVELTYTTTCPVTETKTVGGSTYTNVYTTTSVVVTYVDTTVVATATAPDVTKTAEEVVYTTKTSLCPVTETQTLGGETVVVTWTSTATIVTEVGETETAFVSSPPVTKTEGEVVYTTKTSLCPITETKTVGGETITVTWLSTSTIVTEVVATKTDIETAPPVVETTKGIVYTTKTTLCPVTETQTVGGETITVTYLSTSTIVTEVVATKTAIETAPPVTKTTAAVVVTTKTSLCPVTETKTVGGETVVVTWTSTSTYVTEVPVTKTEYTSYTVTEHVATSVYETVTEEETTYATVSKGVTVFVTDTNTLTATVTEEFTKTETIPCTVTEEVEITITSEATVGNTVTAHPTVVVTYSNTTVITRSGPPITVVYPTTILTGVTYSSVVTSVETSAVYPTYPTYPGASSSTSEPVATALAPRATPIAALILGAAGLVAML